MVEKVLRFFFDYAMIAANSAICVTRVACFTPDILSCIASFSTAFLGRMIVTWSRFLYQICTREMLQCTR